MAKKIELKVIIHPTPASLRFGDDGYFVTFAGTEADQEQAAALILLKKTPLKITVEIDAMFEEVPEMPEHYVRARTHMKSADAMRDGIPLPVSPEAMERAVPMV